MDFTVIIPARYASTRLPGKPLIEVGGKPLIQWVCESAGSSSANEVLVATDDERIEAAVEAFGGRACLTRADHNSGSDRIAEAVEQLELGDDDIVVNVQGDEPRMPGALIDQVARLLLNDDSAVVGTACHPIEKEQDFLDPHVVKVVRDGDGTALYFSRAPIPYSREGAGGKPAAYRHIGIYSYRAGFLRQFTGWAETDLERTERLEQLRILEHGVSIAVCDAVEMPGPGIDTPGDLENFRNWVNQHG